jgi:hypothetical protein
MTALFRRQKYYIKEREKYKNQIKKKRYMKKGKK